MARLGLQGFSMKQITDTLFVVCRVCTTMVHFVGEHAFLQQKWFICKFSLAWFLVFVITQLIIHDSLQDSGVVGVIILERCRVEPDNESGNRNSFKLGNYM